MSSNQPRQTKNERRDAARLEAAKLREEQARRDRRTRFILIGGLAVAFAVFVTVVILILQQEKDSPLDGVESPSNTTSTGGITFGPDGRAGTTSGEDVPEVGVYLDFMCPVCGEFEEQNNAMLTEKREAGEITLVIHPVSILDRASGGSKYSTRAAQAFAFIAENAPDKALAFMDQMFLAQPEENTSGLTDEQIGQLAFQAGVPADLVDKIADGPYEEYVEGVTRLAAGDPDVAGTRGFGTPTITIDGKRIESNWSVPGALAAEIEAAAAGDAAPQGDPSTEGTDVPVEGTPDAPAAPVEPEPAATS